MVFKASKAITQISLVPNDNPNDTTGCLVDNVRFVPVEFEVTDWNVNLTQPKAPYLYDFGNPIYTSVVIGNPVTDGTATFELTTKVRMKALSIPATDADKIAQKWTCKILQNIPDLPVIPTRKYQLGTQKTTLVPIPCSDPSDQYPSGFDKKSFKKATDVLELRHKDSPLDKPPIYINSNEPPLQSSLGNDILLLAKGQTTFVTWVYVENKWSGEKKYLKWVRWKDNWNVDVNALVLPATVKDNGIANLTKEGEGDGKGSAEPSFRKRNIVFSYERSVR